MEGQTTLAFHFLIFFSIILYLNAPGKQENQGLACNKVQENHCFANHCQSPADERPLLPFAWRVQWSAVHLHIALCWTKKKLWSSLHLYSLFFSVFLFWKMNIYFCKVCISLVFLYKLYSSACNRYSVYVFNGSLCCSGCTSAVTRTPFFWWVREQCLLNERCSF